MKADLPDDEKLRLDALRRYDILDTEAEQAYDDITRIAAHVAGTPISLVSLVDTDRQWFKSKVGLTAAQTPREYAFCAHAILSPGTPLIVPDATRDPRFADNPLVTGAPDIRFYMGAPLVTVDKQPIGTLCVIDRVAREPSPAQIEALNALARQVISQLELRRLTRDLRLVVGEREAHLEELERYRSQLEIANATLLERSLKDKLTGVGNRAAFDERLTEETYRAKRYELPLSLLLIDVDHFKDYNDHFGHPAGDEALRRVARALGDVRPSDFVARYGGEEFAVILPSTGAEMAGLTAERLRRSVEAASFPHRPITVSIGVATLRDACDPTELIAKADEALYAAKHGGRNRVLHADGLRH